MENDIFEMATRQKLRFTFKGQISTEDLWDLSVENLDLIYKSVNAQLKQSQQESLLDKKSSKDKENELRVEIIKYIVNVKLKEAEAKVKAKANKEKKEKLMQALEQRENADILNKSSDEIKKMIKDLENEE